MKKNSHTVTPIVRIPFCRHCGRALDREDAAMKFKDKFLCDSCISEISTEELIRICEIKDNYRLLLELGFTRI